MKLVDLSLKEFADELASSSPAPGGGSVASNNGAMAASLVAMVCELTKGSKKYAEYHELANEVSIKANALKERFVSLIDEDTEAFNVVAAAYAMNKDSDEAKAVRSKAIQDGLKGSCLPPFEVMKTASKTIDLVEEISECFNVSSASDLSVAVLNLISASKGAYLNVLINLNSIKDDEYVNKFKAEADELLNKNIAKCDALYEKITSKI